MTQIIITLAAFCFSNFAFAQEVEPPIVSSKPVPFYGPKFGVGASLSVGGRAKWTKVKATNNATEYDIEANYSNTAAIELDMRQLNQMQFGYVAGLTFEGEKKVTGGKVTGSGATLTFDASDSKVQISTLHGSGGYRWEQIYVLIGINVSSVKFTPASTFTGTTEVSSGIGAQLGGGFYVNENIVLEAVSRSVAIKLKGTSSTGTVTDYDTGFLSAVLLSGKYIF